MATYIPNVTVTEARGLTAAPAPVDKAAVVIGTSSAGSAGLSQLYSNSAALAAAYGYSTALDAAAGVIEGDQNTPGIPIAFYKTASTNPGTYGTIDNTAFTGTAIPTVDATVVPFGDFNAYLLWTVGTTAIGTTGAKYRWALDGNGTTTGARTLSAVIALGTDDFVTIPNSGIKINLLPPTAQATAFIAAAVEARADTLAHLANVVAHDAADTSSAQVALAASSVPTTVAASWAVLNLCRTALAVHEIDIAAHNGPDPVNVVSHIAATDTQTGIDLFVEYHADFNAHLGIALTNSAAGIKAATATVASTVILTTSDLLAPGLALLATYPRRLVFTTAGGTAADAPATAAVVGTDYADAAQTETVTLAQTATTATSTKAWKTITTITYAAADGTGATVAIGYGQAVHNSADSTNTISSTDPTHGTIVANDVVQVVGYAPKWGTSDLDTAGTNATGSLTQSSYDFSVIYLSGPCSRAEAAHVTTLLNSLAAVGKRCTAIVHTRGPDVGESEVTWAAAIEADWLGFDDDRITVIEGHPTYTTDRVTARTYLRTWAPFFFAAALAGARRTWPGGQGLPGVALYTSAGILVGHDDGPSGNVTGLGDAEGQGNRFTCISRGPTPQNRNQVFTSAPWVQWTTGSRIRLFMARRIANAIERAANAISFSQLTGSAFFDTNSTTGVSTLVPETQNALHSVMFDGLTGDFQDDIGNASDSDPTSGLVQVASVCTVASSLVTIGINIAPEIDGWIVEIDLTYTAQQ